MIITLVTLVAGFTSLCFIRRYQHFLDVGNVFTDGIFLVAAAFYIFPDSLQGVPITLVILITFVVFFFYLFSSDEQSIAKRSVKQ